MMSPSSEQRSHVPNQPTLTLADAQADSVAGSPPRATLVSLYDSAIAGAAPAPLVADSLRDFSARPGQRLWLYAFGKAAHPMAASAVAVLQRSLHTIAGGVIVSPEREASPAATITSMVGDHPLPGRASFTAAQRIAESAAGMRSDDTAIVLLSGGASSLIAAPLRGMSESDLATLFDMLLGSGLDVRAMNTVRKRFARWGAGRLALALAPARVHAFLMSDVPGDDPADIGSGPVTADASTVRDVIAVLAQGGVLARLPAAMRDYLQAVGRGAIPETLKSTHPAFAHVSARLIGTNQLAIEAACAHAATIPLPAERAGAPLSGDAARCGMLVAETLLARAAAGARGCIVWGGETTVQLGPPRPAFAGSGASSGASSGAAANAGAPPTGGRCQELALSAARVLAAGGAAGARVTLLAAGTDGRDGPTEAAGAFADAGLWERIRAAGRDPELALARHESFSALAAAGALLPRRRTGTNVMDVVIGVVD